MAKRLWFHGALLFLLAFNAGAVERLTFLDGKLQRAPEPGAIIIELHAAPLLSPHARSAADLHALLNRLERDITGMEPAAQTIPNARKLKHRYIRAFAGASAHVDEVSVERIRQLHYVKAVHPDRVVRAYLAGSVAQIGAPTVWNDFGARGEGVVVAVIDTGIDYQHAALGGGFGPGFKVIGGRDFVNDDNDPMDDEGHGTHVAGIIAANGGGLTGVAPEASLLAYKALDDSGSGDDSSVLAAIEAAVADRAHIVNMSLGRPAYPDDPVVQAIENASTAGTLFVVAAGNSGRFLDIGTPAMAPSAITVGAVDRNDRMAFFSSRGPVVPTGAMKPEVVAPGVSIVSARAGGGTLTASGTSMATPHVAGVAALLLDAHPQWTISRLRSAIINGARPMTDDIMAAGAGRIDAAEAVLKNVLPFADTISFGVTGAPQQTWTSTRTVTLQNTTNAPLALSIAVDGLRDGIEIVPSATSLNVEGGASASLELTLNMDPSKVAAPEDGSLSFGGFLRVAGDATSLSIPWSFVRANRVRVQWTASNRAEVRLATERMMVVAYGFNVSTFDLFIGAGDASLWVSGYAGGAVHQIIRDHVDFSTTSDFTFSPADAPHPVRFGGTDASGRLLSDRGSRSMRDVLILHPYFEKELLDSVFALSTVDQLYVSTLPATARLIAFQRAFDFNPFVLWSAQYEPVAEIDGEVTLTIPASAWQSLSARGIVPRGLAQPYQSMWAGFWVRSPRGTLSSVARPRDAQPAVTGDTTIEAWITSGSRTDISSGMRVDIGSAGRPELSADFAAVDGGIVAGNDRAPRISTYIIQSRRPTVIGAGPAFPTATIRGGGGRMTASLQWLGPHRENRLFDARRTRATLYDANGTAVFSVEPGAAPVVFGRLPLSTPLPAPGVYTVVASASSSDVAGLASTGTLRATFDSTKDDATAPMFTSFHIDRKAITFSTVDHAPSGYADVSRDRTRVEYRVHGRGAWKPLSAEVVAEDFGPAMPTPFVVPDGVLYRAHLPDTLFGPIDVRIAVEDADGNRTEYVAEPAAELTAPRRRTVAR